MGISLVKLDSHSRKYLQKRSQLFVEVENGIEIHGRTMMPRDGLKPKKELQYDTMENRYVKWMMQRLIHKIDDLMVSIENRKKRWKEKPDSELMKRLTEMKQQLEKRRKRNFGERLAGLIDQL